MTEQPAAQGMDEARSSQPSTASKIAKAIVGLGALGALVYYGRQAGDYFLDFANWVKNQGPLGPVVFILGYAAGVVAAAPAVVLTLLGGAIFGLWWGTLWVFCASTLGSAAAFLVARYVAREAVGKKIEGNAKFAAVDRAVGKQGFKIVFLLRLTPIFPFSFGNYALGLTRVRFRDFILGAFGTLPGTFLYVFYGKTIGDIAALAAGDAQIREGAEKWIFIGVGLAATIAVTVLVTRIAGKALKEATQHQATEGSSDG